MSYMISYDTHDITYHMIPVISWVSYHTSMRSYQDIVVRDYIIFSWFYDIIIIIIKKFMTIIIIFLSKQKQAITVHSK